MLGSFDIDIVSSVHAFSASINRRTDCSLDMDTPQCVLKLTQPSDYLSLHSKRRYVQCNEEIGRLEAEQAKAMKVMIQAKSVEIARLCEDTCLAVPNLGVLVDDVESPGQVHHSLCLSKSYLAALKCDCESCSDQ